MLSWPAPEVIWAAYVRCLGAVYAVVFASLLREARIFGGARGIAPLGRKLAAIRRHFAGAGACRRAGYFPTLFWLSSGDGAVAALAMLGVGVGAAVAVGDLFMPVAAAVPTPAALAFLYAAFLSYDVVFDLQMPWDCLLLEAGALAPLLPARSPRGGGAALVAPPHPLAAWAHRWLLFRLMVGFGRLKFVGSDTRGRDRLYIRDFLIFQPIPTRVGHWAHRALPEPAHVVALLGMAIIECVVPFALHFGGERARPFAAILIGALQVGIQLTGNFGHFNVLTLVLCVPALDAVTPDVLAWASSAMHAELSGAVGTTQMASTALLIAWCCMLLVGGVLAFPWASGLTGSWTHFAALTPARVPSRVAQAVLRLYRALAPFRIVHGYGVFPPRTGPPVKLVPVLEGRRRPAERGCEAKAKTETETEAETEAEAESEGGAWQEYEWRYLPGDVRRPPPFVAPHQPRFVYQLYYDAWGIGHENWNAGLFRLCNPYAFAPGASQLERLLERLLEGGEGAAEILQDADPNAKDATGPSAIFARAPFGSKVPPEELRVRLFLYEADGSRRGGAWWKRRCVGTHLPPRRRISAANERHFWQHGWLPSPELWHWDAAVWRRRAGLVGGSDMRRDRGRDSGSDGTGGGGDGGWLKNGWLPRDAALATAQAAESAAPGAEMESNHAITEEDIESFWGDGLVGRFEQDPRLRATWRGLEAAAEGLESANGGRGSTRSARMRRVLSRAALRLAGVVAPLVWNVAPPSQQPSAHSAAKIRQVSSHFDLGLLALHIVAHGKSFYDRALADPSWALAQVGMEAFESVGAAAPVVWDAASAGVGRVATGASSGGALQFSARSGFFLWAVTTPGLCAFHARKLRLLRCKDRADMAKPLAVKAAGFLEMGDILKKHFHSSDGRSSTSGAARSGSGDQQQGLAMQERMDGGWWLPSYEQDPTSMHWLDVHGQDYDPVPSCDALKSKQK